MAGYSPDVIRDFVARFGSIAEAEEQARTAPGFGEAILKIEDEIAWFMGPPGAREELKAEIRSLVVEALRENAPRHASASRRGSGRAGTDYPGPGVEDVVRRARDAELAGENLGRTLRNRIAAEANVTPYEVDLIFALIQSGKLADAGREGCLLIDGQLSPTPAFVNLHELKTAS
jgi:hypothetical protein